MTINQLKSGTWFTLTDNQVVYEYLYFSFKDANYYYTDLNYGFLFRTANPNKSITIF